MTTSEKRKYRGEGNLRATLFVLDRDPDARLEDIAAVLGVTKQAIHVMLKRHAPHRLDARSTARPHMRK